MQKDINITPPSVINGTWALISIIILSSTIIIYFVTKKLLKIYALRTQRLLAERQKPNASKIIEQALSQIEQVRAAITAQQIDPKTASEQLSSITRGAFDQLMNHTTLSQTKYEVAQRNIDKVLSLLELSYPAEFSDSTTSITYALQLCDNAKGVIESCR
jgi:hypothetical protein